MQRFGTPQYVLIRQPRPADRESRFPIPQGRNTQRPRKETSPDV